jgi:hypothetical protein
MKQIHAVAVAGLFFRQQVFDVIARVRRSMSRTQPW